MRQIASWQNPGHWSCNLHRLIMRWGLSLQVKVAHVQCPSRFHDKTTHVPWPVLQLSAWLDTIFKKTKGALLLNGFTVDDEQHERELQSFWELYEKVAPNHEVYNAHRGRLHRVIPMHYHGDEGRGKLRRAILVTSYVAGLPTPGHSFLSRFLCSCYPGERYATGHDGVDTLEALHGGVAHDLLDLFNPGFEALAYIFLSLSLHQVVKGDGTKQTMYIAMIGVRGDWPWQSALDALSPHALARLRKGAQAVHGIHK